MKKLLSLTLAIIMLLSVMPVAYAQRLTCSPELERYIDFWIRVESYRNNKYEADTEDPFKIIDDKVRELEGKIGRIPLGDTGLILYDDIYNKDIDMEAIALFNDVMQPAIDEIEAKIASGEIGVIINTYEAYKLFGFVIAYYDDELWNETYEKIKSNNEMFKQIAAEIEGEPGDLENQADYDNYADNYKTLSTIVINCLDGNHNYIEETDGKKICDFCGTRALAGKYGDNLYWEIDNEDRLILSGSGDAWDIDKLFEYLADEFNDHEELEIALSSIKEMFISDSVSQIGCWSICDFYSVGDEDFRCQIEKITVANDNPYLSVENGVLFSKDKTELICYPKVTETKEYTVPEGVKRISDFAFYGCTTLTDLKISNSVDYIGMLAFCSCRDLQSVKMPEKLTFLDYGVFENCSQLKNVDFSCVATIPENTFSGCYSLEELVIPEGVTAIESGAFFCGIKSIVIPKSMERIDGDTFYYAGSLKDVYYCGTEEEWNQIHINPHYNDPILNADFHFEVHKDDDANGICDYCKANLNGDDNNSDSEIVNCSCNCHKSGFMGFIWKIINFFNRIFGSNKICACGASHY